MPYWVDGFEVTWLDVKSMGDLMEWGSVPFDISVSGSDYVLGQWMCLRQGCQPVYHMVEDFANEEVKGQQVGTCIYGIHGRGFHCAHDMQAGLSLYFPELTYISLCAAGTCAFMDEKRSAVYSILGITTAR